jgi:hypothetical protein
MITTGIFPGVEASGADKTTPADFPAAGTLVTIAEGDPRIKTVDGVRVGKWCGVMFCPFAGTSVKLIGNSGTSGGMADIYVDGIYQQTADWYSDKALSNVTVFAVENLTDGRHVLEVLTRGGTKSAEFKGRSINWSRIEYIAGAHPERFVPVRYTQFVPNVRLWLDDHGEPLQCHMGGVMFHDGRYYMVGSDWPYSYGTDPSIVKSRGHCIYSSPDLLNWTYLTNAAQALQIGRAHV